ncbi:MAG: peptidoglycan DD-metalloendopeptidase family protein [Clostridia bacterium]|nr:peptidoglycan DD-metalloendopeptidase family protein [Clostridia bacterium]
MRKTIKTILMLWVAFAVLAVLTVGIAVAALNASDFSDNASVREYQNSIAKYEKQMDALKDDLAIVRSERYSVQQEVNNIDSLMTANENLKTATEALISEYEKQIAEKQEQIDGLSAEISEMETEIAVTKDKFLSLIRIQYENGSPSVLEAIYESDGLTDMLSRMEYMGSIMKYNSTLLEKYAAEKQELDTKKNECEMQVTSLEADKADKEAYGESLSAIEKDLESQRATQAALLDSIKDEEDKLQDEYNALSRAEEEESARLEKLLRQLSAQNKGEYVGGKLIWPVDTNIKRISSYYGWRTYYYRGRKITDFHRGIDIPAAKGTNIYAVQGGEVILSTWHSSYGYYCIVDHGGGISTLYAHCSELLVKVGDKVAQGEHIAEMGSTGQSTGSHLHFEVRVNGKHEDPIANGWLVQPK